MSSILEVRALLSQHLPPGHSIVSIDGTLGSGKTRLAAELAPQVGAEHIELDTFLERKKGGFRDFLRYDELRQRMGQLAAGSEACLVEGICILEVLDRIHIQPHVRIYVKRLDALGHWTEGEVFEAGKTAEQAILQEEEKVGALPGTRREVMLYHYAYWPHENADVIFERNEDSV